MAQPVEFHETGKVVNFYGRTDTTLDLLNLHFTGGHGDTTTADISGFNRTLTVSGSVSISTDQFVSSPSSSFFPTDGSAGAGGGTNFWSVAVATDFGEYLGGNRNWEMETYVRFDLNNQGRSFFFSWFTNAFAFVQFQYSRVAGENKLIFSHRKGAEAAVEIKSSTTFIPTSQHWYGIKLIRQDNVYQFWIDEVDADIPLGYQQLGNDVAETTSIDSASSGALATQAMRIGTDIGPGTPNRAFQGYMDVVRITATVPRPINFYG